VASHTAPESSTVSAISEDFVARAPFSREFRELVIGAAGVPLTIHHPINNAVKGSVVLVPGWSGPRSGPADILVYLASQLASNGYRAVRLDLPGRGDAPGAFVDCDLDKMIEATVKTIQEFQLNGRCTLVGMCSGGNVSLGAAPLLMEASPRVDVRVLALSTLPFQPARSKSFENRRRWKNIKQYAAKAFSPRTWLRVLKGEVNLDRVKKNVTGSEKPGGGERNLKDSARNIERELIGWKEKGLFIWGGGDEEATLARAHFEKLHGQGMAAQDQATFHTIDGANHNFYAKAWREDIARRMLAFVG